MTLAAVEGQIDELARRVKALIGLDLEDRPVCSRSGGFMVWGIGSGRWVAFADDHRPDWQAQLAEQLNGFAAVFDHSSQWAMWELSGDGARSLLQKGLFVDLDDAAFPIGSCCTGMAAEVTMTAARVADSCWQVAIPRSYSDHVLHWVETASAYAGIELRRGEQSQSPIKEDTL